MIKSFVFLSILVAIAVFFLVLNFNNLKTVMNPVQISLSDSVTPSISIKVALLGDLHLDEGKKVFSKFSKIVEEIKNRNPNI